MAGITLLKSLIDALNGTFGAKAEYRGLIAELYCLERALVAIKEIEVRENSSEFGRSHGPNVEKKTFINSKKI